MLFDVGIPNLVSNFSWDCGVVHYIFGHFEFDIVFGLISCLEHISYITANFPQMCLMLGQLLWGPSSSYCDISCYSLNLH